MKVHLLLCTFIIIQSDYSLSKYNDLCITRHGDYLTHPNDCHKFIRCSHGQAYEFKCPGNLWWHQKVKSCDYIYRSKCELNIGKLSNYTNKSNENVSSSTVRNLTKSKISVTAMDSNDTSTTVLVTEPIIIENATQFSEIKIVTSKQLSTREMPVNLKQLSIEQDMVALTKQSFIGDSGLLTPPNSITEQYIDFTTVDYARKNVLGFSSTEDTIIKTEQFTDVSTLDYATDNAAEISSAASTINLVDKYTESTTEFVLTQPFTESLTIGNVAALLTEDTINLTVALNENSTTESITELSTISSIALNVSKLPFKENSTYSTEQLLANNITDFPPELLTKENKINLTGDTKNLKAENVTKNLIDYPTSSQIVESTKPPYKGNKNEILKTITDTTITSTTTTPIYTTETTTDIIYQLFVKNAKTLEISPDNNKENTSKASENLVPSKLLNSTLKPSIGQPLLDTTTQDPRLPFRAYECQGENNRQQFKALKCYQYYQCFAGWAFLLNCHEGWWFQADIKRCVRIEDNECGY